MEYLHEFETLDQFSDYVNSEDYKEPFTALVDETGLITYNILPPPEIIIPGPVGPIYN